MRRTDGGYRGACQVRRALLLLIATVFVLVGTAGAAAAHSELVSTSPAASAVVPEAPREVELRFNQSVEASFGAIRVYDRDGDRIGVGAVGRRGGAVVVAALPPLPDGGYVVTWRVASADSHPIQGAFTFRVGRARADAGDAALARRLLAEDGGSPATGLALAVARWLALAGLLVLVGGWLFAVVIDPATRTDRRARVVLWWAWGGLVLGTAAGLLIQPAYAAGLPLTDVLDGALLSSALDTRFGRVWLARLVLAALAAALLRRLGRDSAPGVGTATAAALVGLGLLATPALSGHAAVGSWAWLAVALDVIHLAAVSTWVGGLVMLLAARLRPDRPDPRVGTRRFSRIAAVAVAVVLVTGVLQGWREVRPWAALTSTTYGGLLLGKLVAFAAIVGVATVSRRWVLGRGGRSDDVRVLRRAVGGEVAIAVGVLVLTSLLVASPPARVAFAQPFHQTLRTESLWIDVAVDPAKAGETEVHVYTYTPGGELTPVEEVTLSMRLPAQDIGPLEIPLERAGPAHFAAYGVTIPLAGMWQLEVAARVDSFTEVRETVDVEVR